MSPEQDGYSRGLCEIGYREYLGSMRRSRRIHIPLGCTEIRGGRKEDKDGEKETAAQGDSKPSNQRSELR